MIALLALLVLALIVALVGLFDFPHPGSRRAARRDAVVPDDAACVPCPQG